jgi:hypothetical protein
MKKSYTTDQLEVIKNVLDDKIQAGRTENFESEAHKGYVEGIKGAANRYERFIW